MAGAPRAGAKTSPTVDKAGEFPMRIAVMSKILVVGRAGYVRGGVLDRLIAVERIDQDPIPA